MYPVANKTCIYIQNFGFINSVDKSKILSFRPPRRSTTVSLETNPLARLYIYIYSLVCCVSTV